VCCFYILSSARYVELTPFFPLLSFLSSLFPVISPVLILFLQLLRLVGRHQPENVPQKRRQITRSRFAVHSIVVHICLIAPK
ncbi:hypothetical protein M440DRAFT_1470463, partial [Trichoderma longibrachiatum ATCC 18648]